MTSHMDARAALILYAARQLGRAYIWGGESSEEGGFDCSGFVSRCLGQAARSWSDLYDGGRRTSRGLYAHFRDRGCRDIARVEDLVPGSLVFYSRNERIYHVAIHCVTVPPIEVTGGPKDVGPLAIESGGGGSRTTSPRASLLSSAGVRLSASDKHGTARWVAVDPFEVLGDGG